ncbi:hypothetical protein [Caenimonas aquaedulcis]|uniref:Uncharacterized protein n=1 Tax=Caenimonas aquaedulcis TaxID=2793270 RepID=A0A931H5D1_9BURK|nr:hypothetical protein [Caenimonas aquaedulcis]MBG9388763.1 hypothetical protein [Caenimonas aquaedulcis]
MAGTVPEQGCRHPDDLAATFACGGEPIAHALVQCTLLEMDASAELVPPVLSGWLETKMLG